MRPAGSRPKPAQPVRDYPTTDEDENMDKLYEAIYRDSTDSTTKLLYAYAESPALARAHFRHCRWVGAELLSMRMIATFYADWRVKDIVGTPIIGTIDEAMQRAGQVITFEGDKS